MLIKMDNHYILFDMNTMSRANTGADSLSVDLASADLSHCFSQKDLGFCYLCVLESAARGCLGTEPQRIKGHFALLHIF